MRDQRSTGCLPQRDQHLPKHQGHGLDGEAEWDPGDTRYDSSWGGPDPKSALIERAYGSPVRYGRRDQLNQWIEQFGAEPHPEVVDYPSALVTPDRKTYQAALTMNGLHPLPLGMGDGPSVKQAMAADEGK
jgi:hypothetical protein